MIPSRQVREKLYSLKEIFINGPLAGKCPRCLADLIIPEKQITTCHNCKEPLFRVFPTVYTKSETEEVDAEIVAAAMTWDEIKATLFCPLCKSPPIKTIKKTSEYKCRKCKALLMYKMSKVALVTMEEYKNEPLGVKHDCCPFCKKKVDGDVYLDEPYTCNHCFKISFWDQRYQEMIDADRYDKFRKPMK